MGSVFRLKIPTYPPSPLAHTRLSSDFHIMKVKTVLSYSSHIYIIKVLAVSLRQWRPRQAASRHADRPYGQSRKALVSQSFSYRSPFVLCYTYVV